MKPHQVVGGPDWVRRDMFQIDARAGFDALAHQIKQMVQSLLADRFKLVSRRRVRARRRSKPVFAVALEEQLGLKLQSRRGPVKGLMIDSVQQPSEN